jgi:hypothetical protein
LPDVGDGVSAAGLTFYFAFGSCYSGFMWAGCSY